MELKFENLPEAVGLLSVKLDRIERLLTDATPKAGEPQNDLLKPTEAAELLNYSVPTLYSKVSRGELPNMKRGGRLYFSRAELQTYIKQGRRMTTEEAAADAVDKFRKQKGGSHA
jgi:excisionase family DNA binding protein